MREAYYPWYAPHSQARLVSASARTLESESASFARQAADRCADNKGNDVVLIDLRGVTDMTDYFVIASGTSDTHVRGIAEHVMADLAALGMHVAAVEGLEHGRWVVLDYVDFVVHLFHPSLRSYYQLERLWGDAPALALTR